MWSPANGLPFADVANPKPGEWPTYHGKLSGNRHSDLDQIHRGNVADLSVQWLFPVPNSTGLYYVMALEKCNIYTKSSAWWEPGRSFYGGAARAVPGEPGKKFLRAIDVQTGDIVWEYAQEGRADTWGGVVSTAGGLVFFGDDSGAFAAADARTGEVLWHFHTNQLWKASPMTYAVDGKQFVAVAAGSNILTFALP